MPDPVEAGAPGVLPPTVPPETEASPNLGTPHPPSETSLLAPLQPTTTGEPTADDDQSEPPRASLAMPAPPSLQLSQGLSRPRAFGPSSRFVQTIADPTRDPLANSQMQHNAVTLWSESFNALAERYPEINRHWFTRAPEWLATYLAMTHLRIYGHELGHERVAEANGADASITMGFHHGVTRWHVPEDFPDDGRVRTSAAGMNQGEMDSVYSWRQAQMAGEWSYQSQMAYLFHHFNVVQYGIASSASVALGMEESGDDVSNWLANQQSGLHLDHGHFLGAALGTFLASPDTWQALAGQIQFLGRGERYQEPWHIDLGAAEMTMPHFRMLLGPDDQVFGVRVGFRLPNGTFLESSADAGIASGRVRGQLRANDLVNSRWVTISPYIGVTSNNRDGEPGLNIGTEVQITPLADADVIAPLRGLTLSVSAGYQNNDLVNDDIQGLDQGFTTRFGIGFRPPSR